MIRKEKKYLICQKKNRHFAKQLRTVIVYQNLNQILDDHPFVTKIKNSHCDKTLKLK